MPTDYGSISRLDYIGNSISTAIKDNNTYVDGLVRAGLPKEAIPSLGVAGTAYSLSQEKNALDNQYQQLQEEISFLQDALDNPLENILFVTYPWNGLRVSRKIAQQDLADNLETFQRVQRDLGRVDREIADVLNPPALQTFRDQQSVGLNDFEFEGDVKVNAPMPKEAYFRSIQTLFDSNSLYAGNSPSNITDAEIQWRFTAGGAGSKGMIQTWEPPSNYYSAVDASGSAVFGEGAYGSTQKYGFKFLYNPEAINMVYGGVVDFDITTLTSGTTKTYPVSPNVFQSTLSFTIPLNRMFDMRYFSFDTRQGLFKQGNTVNTIYPYQVPTSELVEIREKGTMYDVEYLLKSILGLEIPTQFRGNTADIGFLYGRPVEIHLGKSLRYLGTIGSFTLNHTLFDSRMVPIFSYIDITINRIPDYSGTAIQTDLGS